MWCVPAHPALQPGCVILFQARGNTGTHGKAKRIGVRQHPAHCHCNVYIWYMAAARAPPVTLLHLNTTADCLWTPSAGAPHQPYAMQECATLLQQSPRKSVCNLCMVTLCIHLACACTVATARVRKRFDTHTHTRNITARRRTNPTCSSPVKAKPETTTTIWCPAILAVGTHMAT